MSIEICIPAYNEEQIIAGVASEVLRVLRAARKDVRVTVSDNASTDATARLAGSVEGVSVLSSLLRGKGAAVIAAARRSRADIFGFIDADLSVDPEEIVSFLPLLERGECDIVIGSRLIEGAVVDRGVFRTVSSRIFNAVRKAVVGVGVSDTQCGLKLMNARGRDILAACRESGWFFDMEFLARAELMGLSVREVPVVWREHRFAGRASKLNHVRDSIESLRAMFRIRRLIRAAGISQRS